MANIQLHEQLSRFGSFECPPLGLGNCSIPRDPIILWEIVGQSAIGQPTFPLLLPAFEHRTGNGIGQTKSDKVSRAFLSPVREMTTVNANRRARIKTAIFNRGRNLCAKPRDVGPISKWDLLFVESERISALLSLNLL